MNKIAFKNILCEVKWPTVPSQVITYCYDNIDKDDCDIHFSFVFGDVA